MTEHMNSMREVLGSIPSTKSNDIQYCVAYTERMSARFSVTMESTERFNKLKRKASHRQERKQPQFSFTLSPENLCISTALPPSK